MLEKPSYYGVSNRKNSPSLPKWLDYHLQIQLLKKFLISGTYLYQEKPCSNLSQSYFITLRHQCNAKSPLFYKYARSTLLILRVLPSSRSVVVIIKLLEFLIFFLFLSHPSSSHPYIRSTAIAEDLFADDGLAGAKTADDWSKCRLTPTNLPSNSPKI